MKILGISGSLRTGSFNTKLLRNAQSFAPPDVQVEIFDISVIPLYNGDLDTEVKPPGVAILLDEIRQSDGLLLATPEYNYSISGVLKNVIDWVSRPAYKSVLAEKPAGIVSAARGLAGGARAQSQLRHVLSATLTPVYPNPEYLLPHANTVFNESGGFLEEDNRQRLEKYLQGFYHWIKTKK